MSCFETILTYIANIFNPLLSLLFLVSQSGNIYVALNFFLHQRNLIREATAFLLDVLKPNLPEHGFLQTKVNNDFSSCFLVNIILLESF